MNLVNLNISVFRSVSWYRSVVKYMILEMHALDYTTTILKHLYRC